MTLIKAAVLLTDIHRAVSQHPHRGHPKSALLVFPMNGVKSDIITLSPCCFSNKLPHKSGDLKHHVCVILQL